MTHTLDMSHHIWWM